MVALATLAAKTEAGPDLAPGPVERFAGYGVMGLPFASGHVLAMRRFPASSIGPAYTSVWHRSPEGRWRLWADRPDEQACARYFSAAVGETRQGPIDLDWPDAATIRLRVPDIGLAWSATMAASVPTRALNGVASVLPDRGWQTPWVLGAMGRLAGPALRAGRLSLSGTAPNGQQFIANPRRIWIVSSTSARLDGEDLGPPGPLAEQAALGDFLIPQRGLFVLGEAVFTPT